MFGKFERTVHRLASFRSCALCWWYFPRQSRTQLFLYKPLRVGLELDGHKRLESLHSSVNFMI